jgi:hypothetical protein
MRGSDNRRAVTKMTSVKLRAFHQSLKLSLKKQQGTQKSCDYLATLTMLMKQIKTENLRSVPDCIAALELLTEHLDKGSKTAALRDGVKLFLAELERYCTEGKGYPTLCEEAKEFSRDQKILQIANQAIHLMNIERKAALNQCDRTTYNSKVEKLARQVEELSEEERRNFDNLRNEAVSDNPGS